MYLKELDKTKIKNTQGNSKDSDDTVSRPSDRIEISPEAKMLKSQNIQPRDLEQIKEKVKSNYYNSEEVLSKIASAIQKDLDD